SWDVTFFIPHWRRGALPFWIWAILLGDNQMSLQAPSVPQQCPQVVTASMERRRSCKPQVIRFSTFEVDLQAQELRKAGLRLKLSGQPFQVLAILLEQPGTVVTREELQKCLWPDTFVDVDHNLNTAINKIRKALGDSSENPRFVETLP